MLNPFEEIFKKLAEIEGEVVALKTANLQQHSVEIINREELQKRLGITEPTVIRYEKRGKIPAFRIGSNVRYNWHEVVKALEE